MRILRGILVAELAVFAAIGIVWLDTSQRPAPPAASPGVAPPSGEPALRIGLIPERDIFAQRAHYRALAGYLESRLQRPVELVTLNSYQAVLDGLEHARVDVAFLGSFIAVLAKDRLGAIPLVRPVRNGVPVVYRGVIFVREDSPVRTIEDLDGRSIAMVQATTAGHLFPVVLSAGRDPEMSPRTVWVGTHDQVAQEVADGHVDAGAVKDLRLEAWQQEHPDVKIRRLAVSAGMVENPLWARAGLPEAVRSSVAKAMLGLDSEPGGREVLAGLGFDRYVPCRCEDYRALFELVKQLGPGWKRMGISGRAPWCECFGTTRPDWANVPASSPAD